jgi:hypothetical protein
MACLFPAEGAGTTGVELQATFLKFLLALPACLLTLAWLEGTAAEVAPAANPRDGSVRAERKA